MRRLSWIALAGLVLSGGLGACAGSDSTSAEAGSVPGAADGAPAENAVAAESDLPAQQLEPEPTVIPQSAYESYCTGMGHAYEHRFTVDNCFEYFACVFPDGSECPVEDLVAGKCGSEFSYCAAKGGELLPGEHIGRCKLSSEKVCPELDLFQGLCGDD